eukprot:405570-Pyramimonas_sp.AAC.1
MSGVLGAGSAESSDALTAAMQAASPCSSSRPYVPDCREDALILRRLAAASSEPLSTVYLPMTASKFALALASSAIRASSLIFSWRGQVSKCVFCKDSPCEKEKSQGNLSLNSLFIVL